MPAQCAAGGLQHDNRIVLYNVPVQAEDDPIAPKEAIPFEAIEANPQCLLVLTPTGGHLGWCGGRGGTTGALLCAAVLWEGVGVCGWRVSVQLTAQADTWAGGAAAAAVEAPRRRVCVCGMHMVVVGAWARSCRL